ncbi:HepT-like ribonuclease domain-containing protein [Clostridium frigidicarnis]|uniref:Nucleotidyltransferase domain-containing protein n=1 Tax=Clostridium frigidicarnis TaxID=84698 RepID=A0A1I0VVY3_9CLOT|nr:HepT-like ribonuclease domain-containing protein [Clostridium frigidicarnis]SFA79846.1 Nucleotidyltransferase domain-containing protein [Clostridium frigidicarnis]
MEKIMIKNCKIRSEKLIDVIAIGVFGSYHEKAFDKNRSDIDIMILLSKSLEVDEEFEIEDYLQSILPKYFSHDNIHYTFINGFNYPFSELLLISNNKIILNEEKYLDYVLGYATFKRDRENLEIIRTENMEELNKFDKHKKERLEEKFSESKVFLVKILECIRRNPQGKDYIIDEAMISYFNSFCEFIIDMCETCLVSTENYIPNKSAPEIIELASNFGFISSKDSRKLQNIVKLRNRYTHDYYQRKLSRERILKLCRTELTSLEMFLEIYEEKIRLVIEEKCKKINNKRFNELNEM